MKKQAVLAQVIFSHSLIISKIKEYAQFLNKTYQNQTLVIVAVLNGAAFFAIHLLANLVIDVQIDFVAVSSYQGNCKGEVKFYKKLKIDIQDQHLLIIEDIVDSGQTVKLVYQFLQILKPKTIRVCALIKAPRIKESFFSSPINFLLTLPAEIWVVGFGIDFNERFRNLQDIYAIKWSGSKKLIKTK